MIKLAGYVDCPFCGHHFLVAQEQDKEFLRISNNTLLGGYGTFHYSCPKCNEQIIVELSHSVKTTAKNPFSKDENKFQLQRTLDNCIDLLRMHNYLIEKPGEFKDSSISAASYANEIEELNPILSNKIHEWIIEKNKNNGNRS